MIALVALALAVSPLGSPAGQALTEPLKHSMTAAKVGEWATFKVDAGGDRINFWRVAIVGEQTDKKGRPACWLELDLGQHFAMKAPLLQLKMLVARSEGMTKDGVTRVFIAVGADKPNELSDEAVEKLLTDEHPRGAVTAPTAPALPPDFGITTHTGAPTRLMTLAGTVTATPVEVRLRSSVVKRIWVSEQVPLLHVAKLEIPSITHTIEVRDFGINAQSQMVMPAPGTAKIKLERYDELAIPEPGAAQP